VCVIVTFRLVCSSLLVAESQEDIRIIHTNMGLLGDSDSDVRKATIEFLLRLAEQGMC